jgi:hypothetical protein
MAYEFAAASSQYLSMAATPVSNFPLSFACWFNTTNTTDAQVLMCVNAASSPNRILMSARGDLAGDPIRIAAVPTTGLGVSATTSSGFSAGAWTHACGVFTSSTSRTAYINGGSSATNTSVVSISGIIQASIGSQRFNLFPSGDSFTTGQIAEVGIWNAALTPAEVTSLAKGMTCDKVRPQSLVFYAPLVRDLIDQKAARAIVNNNGATVATHPRVYA